VVTTDLPPLLDWAAHKLEVRVAPIVLSQHRDIRAWTIDLSRYRLKLSDRTPCLALSAEQWEAGSPAQIKRLIDDILIAQGWLERNVLVLAHGDVSELQVLARGDNHPAILIDPDAQQRIVAGGSQALIEEISRQTHISALAPYETSRAVTGEQFFGREAELRTILGNESTSYLIVGNRRMGKTSLMREVMRRLRRSASDGDAIQYFDCSVYTDKFEMFAEIVRRFSPREVDRIGRDRTFNMTTFFQRQSRARKAKIVLGLDEIDEVMDWDRKDNWSVLNTLRAAAASSHGPNEQQPLRVLMAGFRLAKDLAKANDSPIFNFAQLLPVKPFDLKATEQLVIEPLLNLGIGLVDRSAIVQRFLRETGGHPNLIQHYCQYVIRRLDETGSRTVDQALLDGAIADEMIRRRTADELMANAENIEQLIVFTFIEHAWQHGTEMFSLADADGWLHEHGVAQLRGDLEGALDNLITSGVLNRDGRQFAFTFTALPRALLDSRDPAYQIRKIIEEGL
jgi:AAA domain